MTSNMHGHLRDNFEMLLMTVGHAKRYSYYYTAMGNFPTYPTITPERCAEHYRKIIRLANNISHFHPNVPWYLNPGVTPEDAIIGFETNAFCASKFFPIGVTTNSDYGINPWNIEQLYPVYKVHAEKERPALFHGMLSHDKNGNKIDWFDQVEEFIYHILMPLLKKIPKLPVVLEHITTEKEVEFVKECQRNGYLVSATVAPQYLIHDRNWLFEGGMNPINYSIPPLQRNRDRLALIEFVTSGYGFRGNDSAPHDVKAKSKPCNCPGGIFSDADGIDILVYYEVFKQADALDKFENFMSLAGPKFYGLPEVPKHMTTQIVEEEWTVPDFYEYGTAGKVIPLLAGEILPYKVVPQQM